MKKKKYCFVIMGFGKKKDPTTNQTIDLDATYNSIIKPAVEESNYKCIRADEIKDSGLIDRSMYALLYYADLVIADITTQNPNALYELGTRHVLKPYSTIIIKSEESEFPFDLDHNRILTYKHLGNKILDEEITKGKLNIKERIKNIENKPCIDSPIYSFIEVTAPKISQKDIDNIIGGLDDIQSSVYSITEEARKLMSENKFIEAAQKWDTLAKKIENEDYYIQQKALCIYKSEQPDKVVALTEALTILGQLDGKIDTETLGLSGSIQKRLWFELGNIHFLKNAIDSYKKGYTLHEDYYNGNGYALCLEILSDKEKDDKFKIYAEIESKQTREKLIQDLLPTLETNSDDLKWKFATLANSYYSLKNIKEGEKYEKMFIETNPDKWEKDSFYEEKNIINNLNK